MVPIIIYSVLWSQSQTAELLITLGLWHFLFHWHLTVYSRGPITNACYTDHVKHLYTDDSKEHLFITTLLPCDVKHKAGDK